MNIVFVFADDWGRYASAYAKYEGENSINRIIKTPNFDRIATEGAIFKNAFVPAPSCTPCRSSVLSGRYFWQTGLGSILQGAHWDEEIPSYPLELEKNGWKIGYTYKVWSPGDNPNEPYGGIRTQYYIGHEESVNKFTHGCYGEFSQKAVKNLTTMTVEEAKSCMYEETRNSFRKFLGEQKENIPFCYWWGPTNTHREWELGSGKKLWGLEPDDLKGKLPKCLPDVAEIREDFCDYLGECMALDAGIGILIEELEKLRELDNTLFVISGDHGISGMPRGKCNLYDLGNEVALAMRCPKIIKAGLEINNLINIMDLAPTFMDFAGIEIPEGIAGKSLLPLLMGEVENQDNNFVVTGRELHVRDARDGSLPYPQRAIRTKDFLYVVNFEPDRYPAGSPNGLEHNDFHISYEKLCHDTYVAYADLDASPTKAYMCINRNEDDINSFFKLGFDKRPYEELFDLKNDKDNIKNVAEDITYAKVKKDLQDKLFGVLKSENDPRVKENPCKFEKSPYAGKREGRKL